MQPPPLLARNLINETLKVIPEYGVMIYDKKIIFNRVLDAITSMPWIAFKFCSRHLHVVRAAANVGAMPLLIVHQLAIRW